MAQVEEVEEITLEHSMFMNRMTNVYGGTNSGKSTIIRNIVKILRPYIQQCIVICPTDISNHEYTKHLLPSVFVHYALTKELLENIWARQTALCSVYQRVNDFNTLAKLFSRLELPQVQRSIEKMNERKRLAINEIISQHRNNPDFMKYKIGEVDEKFQKLLQLTYKKYVCEYKDYLKTLDLDRNERYSIKYIGINHQLLLIFDDASPELKKFKNDPTILKLFFQCRHLGITTLMAVHHFKLLPSELRCNSHVQVYADAINLRGFYSNTANNVPDELKHRSVEVIQQTFTEDEKNKHQKALFSKEKNKFYRFTAIRTDGFSFYTGNAKKFFDSLQSEGNDVPADSEFIKPFQD